MRHKQIIIAILVFLNTINLFSQPTLTEFNSSPVPGDIFIAYEADTSLQPGSGGANAIWNFGTVLISNNQIVTNFISPSSTPYSNLFPLSTVAQEDGGDYIFYGSNNNNYSVLGQVSNGDSIVYTPPFNIYCYPLTYNLTCPISNYTAEYMGDSIVGDYEVMSDGYGTLILNGITINNILRVKSLHNETIYNVAGTINIHTSTYYWFDGIYKFPLLEIYSSQISGIFTGSDKGVLVNSIITDIFDNLNHNFITVFPNPAGASLYINNINNDPIYEIQIYNNFGQIMESKYSILNNQMIEINIDNLKPGAYYLKMFNKNKTIVKNFVKQQ